MPPVGERAGVRRERLPDRVWKSSSNYQFTMLAGCVLNLLTSVRGEPVEPRKGVFPRPAGFPAARREARSLIEQAANLADVVDLCFDRGEALFHGGEAGMRSPEIPPPFHGVGGFRGGVGLTRDQLAAKVCGRPAGLGQVLLNSC